MLFSNRSKRFSFGVIPTIILMVTILILSGCSDNNTPGKSQQERITKPVNPILKDIGRTILPSVEKAPDVN